jgi:hypothetical protein
MKLKISNTIAATLDEIDSSSEENRSRKQISSELEEAVVDCLIGHWIEQGLTQAQAEASAHQTLERLRFDAGKGTWCMRPVTQV